MIDNDNVVFVDFSQSNSFIYRLEQSLSRIHKAVDDLLILIYEDQDSKVL
jgi:hypothetical protein